MRLRALTLFREIQVPSQTLISKQPVVRRSTTKETTTSWINQTPNSIRVMTSMQNSLELHLWSFKLMITMTSLGMILLERLSLTWMTASSLQSGSPLKKSLLSIDNFTIHPLLSVKVLSSFGLRSCKLISLPAVIHLFGTLHPDQSRSMRSDQLSGAPGTSWPKIGKALVMSLSELSLTQRIPKRLTVTIDARMEKHHLTIDCCSL